VLVEFGAHPAASEPSIFSRDRMHLSARGHAICAADTVRALAEVASARALQAA
jgi:hypothetical protein